MTIFNLLIILISNILINTFIIFFSKRLDLFITDHLHEGPQRFHENPTPRIGGFGIFVALSVGLLLYNPKFWIYIIVSLPVFLSGFIEDLTRSLHPKMRLILMSVGATAAFFILDVKITKVDVPLIDPILSISLISFLFTVFALVGLSNAINIIDGFNGLASGVSIMILLAITYVANNVGDFLVRDLSIMTIFALLGFFILNFPFGKIFLGDGGAYFIGFTIAVLSVMLVKNHPQVSPWFPFLVVIYPVFETIFSFYRKKVLKGKSPFKPDGLHFHMLIYKRVVPFVFDININEKLIRNSATSPFLWLICSIGAIPAVIFWDNTIVLIIFTIVFCIFYVWLYRGIVRFRVGRIMRKLGR